MSTRIWEQHAASVADFRAYASQRDTRRDRRRSAYRIAVHEQYRTTARRLERLGFTPNLPPEFAMDTVGAGSQAATVYLQDHPDPWEESRRRARESRLGFGLKRRELNPAQRQARLKLQLAWFFAVIAVFFVSFSLPHAVAGPGQSLASANVASGSVSPATPAGYANTLSQPGQPIAPAVAAIKPGQTDPLTDPDTTTGPNRPEDPANPVPPVVSFNINGWDRTPSSAVIVFLLITVLSVAPSLILMMTSFTKIFIVLAMARNALGLNQIPPTQVIAGLAVFLSLFIMSPTITTIWDDAVQPYMKGDIEIDQMMKKAEGPIREFMGPLTRQEDIALMSRAADRPNPPSLEETPFTTLVPAFMISEVRAAFIIGFVVFIPFLVIDLVVGASLMSMGMMMLPPVMVSLPFKVLLFVMVDGWGLLTKTLIGTYR